MPKDAASFDLPIALGSLAGSGQIASLDQYGGGELALDGAWRVSVEFVGGSVWGWISEGVPANGLAEVEGMEVADGIRPSSPQRIPPPLSRLPITVLQAV